MGLFRCKEAFSATSPDGIRTIVNPGVVVDAKDWRYVGRAGLFDTVESAAGIERATARPGEKRTTKPSNAG